MKPFNLEAALRGEKVVTRDGQEVTQLTHFKCPANYQLYGVLNDSGNYWAENGANFSNNKKSPNDLFMAKKMRKVQCRLYKSSYGDIYVAINNKEYLSMPGICWVSDIFEVEIKDND